MPPTRPIGERRAPQGVVSEMGRTSERWRYRFVDAIQTREHALGGEAEGTDPESIEFARALDDDFPEIPAEFTEATRWKVVQRAR